MTCWCGTTLTARQVKRGGTACSRAHGTVWRSLAPLERRRAMTTAATAASSGATRKRVHAAVVADLTPFTAADGLVSLRSAVAVVLKHRRLGYIRGWTARERRHRREVAQ